jgi:steroid 5-alpha reductase family enzyme
MIINPLLDGLLAILALMFVLWLFSLYLENVAIVDLFWGPAIALGGCVYWLETETISLRANVVIVLALLWAARLGIYLTFRNAGKPEDRRYRAMRERNDPGFRYKSLYLVFGLQAVLAWIVGLPLYGAITGSGDFGIFDWLGLGIFAFGLVWESLADQQLAHFLRTRENDRAVMDRGVWRYSRHPNYFGEFCLWWGLWLFAVAAGAAWTVVGPLVLTLFLFKVSGVALLEKDIGQRRPEYQAYIERTAAFFPRPPRRSD